MTPPDGGTGRRVHTITVRMPVRMHGMIVAAADHCGVPVATYVREAVLARAVFELRGGMGVELVEASERAHELVQELDRELRGAFTQHAALVDAQPSAGAGTPVSSLPSTTTRP